MDRVKNRASLDKHTADQIRLCRYCARGVLTLLKITVKPALLPIAGQTKIRSLSWELGRPRRRQVSKIVYALPHDKVRRLQFAE